MDGKIMGHILMVLKYLFFMSEKWFTVGWHITEILDTLIKK